LAHGLYGERTGAWGEGGYTRKSTEDGLEPEFDSLDAHRDAGEAYIASQKSEGWFACPTSGMNAGS